MEILSKEQHLSRKQPPVELSSKLEKTLPRFQLSLAHPRDFPVSESLVLSANEYKFSCHQILPTVKLPAREKTDWHRKCSK